MTRKIRMSVDELHVESYPTTAATRGADGTVHGHAVTTLAECSGYVTCASACSATDGVRVCKTCGPCC
jgi:acyl-coenzyme A thioesterase PaaI-like protein